MYGLTMRRIKAFGTCKRDFEVSAGVFKLTRKTFALGAASVNAIAT